VGAQLGIQNIQFPAVVAGDAGRAAFSFIGTTTGGSDLNDAFPGTWYLFVSYTYDGGKTWTTVNATPGLPVQRGGVCMQGTACSGSDRNMLDFNDASIDKAGRVLVAYTDGCVGSCEHDSSSGSGKFASVFALVRQDCGAGLFAGTADFAGDPVCPSPKPTMAETGSVAALGAVGALTLLTVSVVIRRRRRTLA
jgi:hypothetical protein